MDDVIKQRIKYLVEHGELYPTKDETHCAYRKIWIAVSVLAVLQIVDTVMLMLR